MSRVTVPEESVSLSFPNACEKGEKLKDRFNALRGEFAFQLMYYGADGGVCALKPALSEHPDLSSGTFNPKAHSVLATYTAACALGEPTEETRQLWNLFEQVAVQPRNSDETKYRPDFDAIKTAIIHRLILEGFNDRFPRQDGKEKQSPEYDTLYPKAA